MFGIGGLELFLILIFGFLIFGPDKLPEIAKTVGKAIAKFRGAQESMTEQLKGAAFVDKDSDTPLKNPLDVLSEVAGKSSKSAASPKKDPKTGDNAASTTPQSKSVADDSEVSRSDGFAERKARYDRERAERKRAEAQAAAKAKEDAERKEAQKATDADNPKIDVAAKSLEEEGQ